MTFPFPITPARTWGGSLIQMLLLGVVLTASGLLMFELPVFGTASSSSPLWAPSGVAVAGLLLLGPRAWPAVTISTLLYNWNGGYQEHQLVFAGVATLEALLPAILLPRIGWRDASFERLGDVLRYLGVAAIASPLLATGLGALVLQDQQPGQILLIWSNWFASDVAGIMILGPLLLTWLGGRPEARATAGRLERAAIALSLLGAAMLAQEASPLYSVPTFPVLAWAALRAGQRGTTLVSLAIFCITTWVTRRPELGGRELDSLLFLSALPLTQLVTGLLLAASVAERRRSRRVEREMEDAYRALVAAAPFAVIGMDPQGRVTIWSSAAERLFGWTAVEVVGRPLPTIPVSREAEFARLFATHGEGIAGFETVRRRKDGTEMDVALTAWPLFDEEGRFTGTVGLNQDITERKQAERLQRATWRIAQAALTAPDLGQLYAAIHGIVSELMPARNLHIALYDAETTTITFPYWADEREVQPQPRRAGMGLTELVIRSGRTTRDRPAMIGTPVEQVDVQAPASQLTEWMGVPLQVTGRTIGVLAVQSYDSGVSYTEREQAILEFVSGQVGMAIERKRNEALVRQSEERFRVVAGTTNDAVWEWDVVRDTDWWSESVRQVLGYDPSEVQAGKSPWDSLVHPDDWNRVVGGLRAAVAGRDELWREEYRIRRRDGTYAYVFDRARIQRDPTGAPLRVLGAMMDITERREAAEALRRSEEQLRQAVKMEAVGRLAGGVAHDFNNLLTSVLGHADLMLVAISPEDPLYDDLVQIKAAGTRAAALTQQLLAFSRKQVLEPRVVDLNTVIGSLSRMLRRTIGEDIELVTRLAPDLGAVRADPAQMEQVLLNLVVNARDAMPTGGRLTIETSNVQLPLARVVRVRVQDSGVGMTEDVRAHLFEPFFTTKEVGKGTGLGLATAYGIVQQSGGSIAVTSAPGQGTIFIIDLPLVRGEPALVEREPAEVSQEGSESILLVEDEEAVRNLTRRVLEHYGYVVHAAPNGEMALEFSRTHQGPLHLLLTDVVMPGISGPRLAEIMVSERPDLRLIFMSGYAPKALEQKLLVDPESAFLQKPFTTAQLVRRVREVLDGGVRAGVE